MSGRDGLLTLWLIAREGRRPGKLSRGIPTYRHQMVNYRKGGGGPGGMGGDTPDSVNTNARAHG